MKKLSIISLIVILLAGCSPKPTVEWSMGDIDETTGLYNYTLIVNNAPKGTDWSIWFSQMRIDPRVQEGSNGEVKDVSGSLHRAYPTEECNGKLEIHYQTSFLVRNSWAPEMFTLDVKGKKPVALEACYHFPEGDPVSEFVYTPVKIKPEDMIPALKSIEYTGGTSSLDLDKVQYKTIAGEGKEHGWYRIVINELVTVESADEDGLWYARITLSNLADHANGEPVANMTIEDWPDFQYRGVMLDVARNFTKKKDVLSLIDMLAKYKVNVLHLHLCEDEAWRLEIKDIPELTSYGAFHSLPVLNEDGSISEPIALHPAFAGGFFPEQENSSNGYFTKEDFIEILRYADARHIKVIPEMDAPGHARAAIKSIEKYAQRTGDRSYMLSEEGDTSKYFAVHHYSDNSINVALESTYKFMAKYFDTIISYYEEAGVELPAIHIGGDEVAKGAWMGSPSCQKLMLEKGLDHHGLYEYYINRIMDLASARGVKIAGWQEVAHNVNDSTISKLRDNLAFTYCWSTYRKTRTDELPYIYANEGLNVILSNMTNAYADLAYNYSRTEPGHSWGGYVDERRSFSLNPFNIYKSVRWDDKGNMIDIKDLSIDKTELNPGAKINIRGVQAQLWSETIRKFDDVTYHLFPKMLGVFERGWNATPVWANTIVSDDPLFMNDFNRFYSIVETYEYPYYEKNGICYRKHNQ